MAVIAGDGRLTLTGYVGESSIVFDGQTWFDGFTHGEVLAALSDFEDDEPIAVHINSGGGYASEGAAIRSVLAGRAGRTDTVVEGIAASAASLIAMAGQTITMDLGATMMVHDPSGLTLGTADDHEATIKGLNSLATAYARVYARKSGKTEDECREIMRAETWFAPEEAVAAGFATKIGDDTALPVAAFDYRQFKHAPEPLRALASANGWRLHPNMNPASAVPAAARSPASTARKEKPMSDKPKADDQAVNLEAERQTAATAAVRADRDRRQAIMALDEANGRESLAEHLYASTEMDVETVKATLAAAPKAEAKDGPDEYGRARMAGAGLGGTPKPGPTMRVDIVGDMKRRVAQ